MDLREKNSSLAFNTFYLDADYVGAEGIARVRKAFHKAYIEEIGNGIFVSNWIINPKGKKITKDIDRHHTSQVVAEVIANRT